MKTNQNPPFAVLQTLQTSTASFHVYSLTKLAQQTGTSLERLPFSIRILLENALRMYNGKEVTKQHILSLCNWQRDTVTQPVIPFFPGRVILQDFTGVPVLVDLAAMRSEISRLGGDPRRINPMIPVDLVIDHSLQVDYFGRPDAMRRNLEMEFNRNRERYAFLKWGQRTFKNLRIVPPGSGIIHQVNLEYLSPVVLVDEKQTAYPDTVVGTDSHTTMINGLGVLGWGVGGIEATAAMLKQPLDMLLPPVVGFELIGELPEGVTPTDLTLTITQILRKKGVVNQFVEFFGSGVSTLTLSERAMISNMSPENGATITFFPVDNQTLEYLRQTGRSNETIELVERYCKEQMLFRYENSPIPEYSEKLELDLSTIRPSLAGPRRPHERSHLSQIKPAFQKALTAPKSERGFGLAEEELEKNVPIIIDGKSATLKHGSVVIAAITSCTNTSNPFVMIAAGLLAKKAVEKGLTVKPYVKTSLAPGSRIVARYLEQAGLLKPLEQLGFHLIGYGCTTCIGNSGPLPAEVAAAITQNQIIAAAVLSGNRNFEGRINPYTQVNYLASPPLVVAYALAGTVDIDLENEPVGFDQDNHPVFLKDIYPSNREVQELIERTLKRFYFTEEYANITTGNDLWQQIPSSESETFAWQPTSTYIQEPPYFKTLPKSEEKLQNILNARVLAMFGDSITTDHISPAGNIPADSVAGKFLQTQGVSPEDFNSYGARRGNHEVMMRGTFANIRLKNLLLPGTEGGYTLYLPENIQMSIYEAAMRYQENGIPLIVIAGKEYGSGSSRDWAAKGPMLLGVKAVIAESFERIHRSNLAGMGILPLQFLPGENAHTLNLTGRETYTIHLETASLHPGEKISVCVKSETHREFSFQVILRLDTPLEVEYYRNGGILPTILLHEIQKNE